MIKKTFLCFLCLCLFLSVSTCKKKTPTEPVVPELILPVIEYFNASPESMLLGSSSTLSWNTKNATNVTIDQGVGTVPATGTTEVSPEETTTYTLTAINSDGQKTSSRMVEIKKWAVVDISTIPELVWFYYDPIPDTCTSDFTLIMTETNGIGGRIDSILIGGFLTSEPESICNSQECGGGIFNPLGSLSVYCSLVIPCKPTIVIAYINGVDDNGYIIEEAYWWTILWTQNSGTMRFLRVVEGANHHKRIR